MTPTDRQWLHLVFEQWSLCFRVFLERKAKYYTSKFEWMIIDFQNMPLAHHMFFILTLLKKFSKQGKMNLSFPKKMSGLDLSWNSWIYWYCITSNLALIVVPSLLMIKKKCLFRGSFYSDHHVSVKNMQVFWES